VRLVGVGLTGAVDQGAQARLPTADGPDAVGRPQSDASTVSRPACSAEQAGDGVSTIRVARHDAGAVHRRGAGAVLDAEGREPTGVGKLHHAAPGFGDAGPAMLAIVRAPTIRIVEREAGPALLGGELVGAQIDAGAPTVHATSHRAAAVVGLEGDTLALMKAAASLEATGRSRRARVGVAISRHDAERGRRQRDDEEPGQQGNAQASAQLVQARVGDVERFVVPSRPRLELRDLVVATDGAQERAFEIRELSAKRRWEEAPAPQPGEPPAADERLVRLTPGAAFRSTPSVSVGSHRARDF